MDLYSDNSHRSQALCCVAKLHYVTGHKEIYDLFCVQIRCKDYKRN